jgi:hypothetical protein
MPITEGLPVESDWPPYDYTLYHVPNANTQATITFPITAGKRWKIATITVSLSNTNAGAAISSIVRLLDGAAPLWEVRMGISAATGSQAFVALSGLAYPGTVGNPVILEFTGASGVNTAQTVAAGAYLID